MASNITSPSAPGQPAGNGIFISSPYYPAEQEEPRIEALRSLDLLDTEHEEEFDELVQLASEICNTPISLVSLVDSDRQWFKARVGTDLQETARDYSFCAHALGQADVFIVEDATHDPRFCENPLVTGETNIRFYAGVPLHTSSDLAVGTLCVIDTKPRSLSAEQQNALRILARQVRARLELRAQKKALARANADLERLATTDALTGLANRRAFQEQMETQFAVAVRNNRPLTVLLMDVDDFKKRNDRFGHKAGDDALRAIGFVLQQVVRAGELAARIGGEEFAVLMPEAEAPNAKTAAVRIQSALAQFPLESGTITVSIGVASRSATTHSWERLLECSDDAMYHAKKTGKNRVVVHSEYICEIIAESSDTL